MTKRILKTFLKVNNNGSWRFKIMDENCHVRLEKDIHRPKIATRVICERVMNRIDQGQSLINELLHNQLPPKRCLLCDISTTCKCKKCGVHLCRHVSPSATARVDKNFKKTENTESQSPGTERLDMRSSTTSDKAFYVRWRRT